MICDSCTPPRVPDWEWTVSPWSQRYDNSGLFFTRKGTRMRLTDFSLAESFLQLDASAVELVLTPANAGRFLRTSC
jgi:hypothetical protein